MFKLLWRKKSLIVFLIALIVLFPRASIAPAQMLSKTLLVSVGIDKTDGEYEISGTMIVNEFSQTGKSKSQVVSGKGSSINAAMNNISANQGREVSLAHCNLIIIGSGVKDENLAATLNHFLKKFEMSNNALLVYTESDVKKMQEISLENKTGASGGLAETIAAKNQKDFARVTTLESFYKDYLRLSQSGATSMVELKEDSLENPKTTAIFKKGKHSFILNSDQTQAVGFLNRKNAHQNVMLSGVSGGNLTDAQVTLRVTGKHSSIKTKFKDGKPYAYMYIKPTLQIEEITNLGSPEQFFDFEENPPIETVRRAFCDKISNDLNSALEAGRTNYTDFLKLYDRFYREHSKLLKKYMNDKTLEKFIEEIVIDTNVEATIVV